MNWQTQSEEKLDNIPVRERVKHSSRYRDLDFDYTHFYKFLQSRVGQPIDKVIHEFVNCDWCPPRYRRASKVAEAVEMNTFYKAGKVYYYADFGNRWIRSGNERCVDDEAPSSRRPFLYLHPATRCLCEIKRQPRKSYRNLRQEALMNRVRFLAPYHQFVKLKGLWFEVTTKISKDHHLSPYYGYRGEWDIILDPESRYKTATWHYIRTRDGNNWVVREVIKRQLNSGELHRYGLVNDPEAYKPCPKCGGEQCQHFQEELENSLCLTTA